MSKIYHFNDLEEFFSGDEWKIQIDVSDIWNQYEEKKFDLKTFNAKYYNRMLEYKEDISNLGNDVWEKLGELLSKMKDKVEEKELNAIYDEIYNWGDKNDVLIKIS